MWIEGLLNLPLDCRVLTRVIGFGWAEPERIGRIERIERIGRIERIDRIERIE